MDASQAQSVSVGAAGAAERGRLGARPARREELRWVARMLADTIRTHPSYSPAHRAFELRSMRAARLEEIWRSAPWAVMVGTVDGAPVAFSIAEPDNGIGWLRWGVALPEHRRTGIATFVLGVIVEHYRAAGVAKLCAVTRTDNRPAAALLKQRRFRIVCEMQKHWFGEDFHYWERMLDPPAPRLDWARTLPLRERLAIRLRHAALDLLGRP